MRRRRSEWRRLVDEWHSTGETAAEFAARHEVTEGTLMWWVYRFRREAKADAPPAKSTLVEVVQAEPAGPRRPEAGPFALQLAVGPVSMAFAENPNVGYLAALVRGIQGAGS